MKKLVLCAALVLAGCAADPQYVARQSDWDVCRLTMGGPGALLAQQEAQRRGLDCRPFYPSIAAQQGAMLQYLGTITPVPLQSQSSMPMPTHTQCSRVGNQVNCTTQ